MTNTTNVVLTGCLVPEAGAVTGCLAPIDKAGLESLIAATKLEMSSDDFAALDAASAV